MAPTDESNEVFHAAHPGDFIGLLARARQGCPKSRIELVEHYRPYLLHIANAELNAKLRIKVAASDVVQESMVAAFNELDDFRGETVNEWMGWLRSILTNDLRQARRAFRGTSMRQLDREIPLQGDSRNSHAPLDVTADYSTPASRAIASEEEAAMQSAIERLPVDYQQVIELYHGQSMTFKEIGRRLGRSADAARKLWYRALLQLKRELASYEPTSDTKPK